MISNCFISSILSGCFDEIINQMGIEMPEAEDFAYEEKLGYSCWIADRRVLVGNRQMLIEHSIPAPTEYEEKAVKKRWKEDSPAVMTELVEVLRSLEDFSCAAAEPAVLGWITEKGYHMGNVMNAFRLTVVGECKGPHMFDITELIGKEETIARVKAGIDKIGSNA